MCQFISILTLRLLNTVRHLKMSMPLSQKSIEEVQLLLQLMPSQSLLIREVFLMMNQQIGNLIMLLVLLDGVSMNQLSKNIGLSVILGVNIGVN